MTATDQQAGSFNFAMTELDEKLRGSEGPVLAAGIIERFDSLIKQLEENKSAGLSPEDFAATETFRKAVAGAAQTVIAFTKFHQQAAGHEDKNGNGNDVL